MRGSLPVAMDVEAQKRAAADAALEFVRPGMRLGLGSGSTAKHCVELLAERVRAGLDVIGVPTSEATRADAERLGVPLTSLDEMPQLDLTIDGADEIAADLSLIKGGGGALLREKMVASASARMVVIADESKCVSVLGRFPLPIEVVPFGLAATRRNIEAATVSAGCGGAGMATLSSRTAGTGFWMPRSSGSPIRDRSRIGSTASRAWSSTACSSGSHMPPWWPARAAYGSSSGVEPASPDKEGLHVHQSDRQDAHQACARSCARPVRGRRRCAAALAGRDRDRQGADHGQGRCGDL